MAITNPAKPFWPALKLTKGDLFRYYATVAPYILPAVQDRPLVMKRFPNGVDGKAFYQQRSRLENPPPGVRIETIADDIDPISEPDARRLIGGSLITLLYMTQIAAISQDPWFSRVQSPLDADYVAIDLDPGEGTTFPTVLEVARLVHEELASMKVPSVPKTSGSRGLHIYIPLAPGTTYESGMLFCQIVATVVATRHPKIATVERTVRARRKGRSTSITCRTSWAKRWQPPTAPAPATTPASRRRSSGRKCSKTSIRTISRSRPRPRVSRRWEICGPDCGHRSPPISRRCLRNTRDTRVRAGSRCRMSWKREEGRWKSAGLAAIDVEVAAQALKY